MKLPDFTVLTRDKVFTSRVIFLGFALICLVIGSIFSYNYTPAKWMTYRDFDVPGEKNFINYLNPGVKDVSTGTAYQFEEPHWLLFFIIIFGFFPFMFFLRVVSDTDFKMKVHRYLTQWLTFVTARLGILRVTGVCPAKRTGLGVFSFMNCQSCELATGACPLGTFQMSMLNKEIPFALIGQLILTGLIGGRWVCGWLCPYGFLMDIFDKLPGKRIKLHLNFTYIKYVFLAILVISSIAYMFKEESEILLYCSYFCPVGFYYGVLEYALTTGLESVLEQMPFIHFMLVYHFLMGLMVIIGSIKLGGRFFCKYACPLGAVYGLFAKISVFKIELNNNKCVNCGKCEKVCPMDISILDESLRSRSCCISCTRCVKACPSKKIEFKASLAVKPQKKNIPVAVKKAHPKEVFKPVLQKRAPSKGASSDKTNKVKVRLN